MSKRCDPILTVNERERLRRDDVRSQRRWSGYVYDNLCGLRGLRDGRRSVRQTWGPCPKRDALALVRALGLSMHTPASSLVIVLLLAAASGAVAQDKGTLKPHA